MAFKTLPAEERFVRRFEIDEDGCWPWTGYVMKNGYGTFRVNYKSTLVHRFAYEHFVEPIPDGMTIDHLCRNRRCVNPDHLEAVTLRENLLRGEGASAKNARKTHCLRGHPFEGDNLFVSADGVRYCRKCNRIRHGGAP